MDRNGVVAGLLLAFMGVLSHGCDDPPREVSATDAAGALGDVYCERMFSCDCDSGHLFDSESACRTDMKGRIDQLRGAGESAGLLYDPTCIGAFLDMVDAAACGPRLYDFSECKPACNPYFGPKHLGESCEHFSSGVHDCDKGLDCIGSTCQAPCDSGATDGEVCDLEPCREGLYCNQNQICFALPSVGQPCPFSDCAPGAYCDIIDTTGVRQCFALGANGIACSGHLQCESGYCPIGRCAPRPLRFEACPAEVCAPDLACRNQVCEDAAPALCYAGTPY